jgi:enamine deaminase RidA (YjgF/YER057c/UK114 family)
MSTRTDPGKRPAKEIVSVPGLEDPRKLGYSQCVRVGDLVFVAGQCGQAPDEELVSLDFEPQARRALERVQAAVEAAGGSIHDIVSMTIFITDARFGPIFSEMRRDFFGDRHPACALIVVSALMPLGALVEVQALAMLGAGR